MKYEGIVTLKKTTPQGMEFVGTIKELPIPMTIFIPLATDLQPEGTITIEILRVGEKAEPIPEPPVEASPPAEPTGIRAMISKARRKALG